MSKPRMWLQAVSGFPGVSLFALEFRVEKAGEVELFASADERCILLLDGVRVGAFPEYGDAERWFMRRLCLSVQPGVHRLVARVFALGTEAAKPRAQISIAPGFWLESPTHPELDTATGEWRCLPVAGVGFSDPLPAWGTGAKPVIDGTCFPWQAWWGRGELAGWPPARRFEDGRELEESGLPPQKYCRRQPPVLRHADACASGTRTGLGLTAPDPCRGEVLLVAPGERRRLIFDFGGYVCAWLRVMVAGAGGDVAFRWAETLFDEYAWVPDDGAAGVLAKGDRDEVAGKVFHGVGDRIRPGTQCGIFDSFWWNPGRYLEVTVTATDCPVALEQLQFFDAGYPLPKEFLADCSDAQWRRTLELCRHTLEMCSHDTWYDCPYYEQLMYVGDAMIENLLTLTVTRDRRLPIHAVTMLQRSRRRNPDGMLHSRWPSWDCQVIPSFVMFNVLMIYDLARYTALGAALPGLLDEVRLQLERLMAFRGGDGLLRLPGWNYIDWVWPNGVPDGLEPGEPNAIENWLLVLALERAAALERYAGSGDRAGRWELLALEISRAVEREFWSPEHAFYAIDRGRSKFSEHAQIAALLTRSLPEERRGCLRRILEEDTGLMAPESNCFAHLFFLAAEAEGVMTEFFRRFDGWKQFAAQGLTTVPEQFARPRSDCHAWSAHPLFHYFAGVLGIRPADFAFRSVEIAPQPGRLAWVSGRFPHAAGDIDLALRRVAAGWECEYVLPDGLPATLVWNGERRKLLAGNRCLRLPELSVPANAELLPTGVSF